jgi:cation diffusion facilitator CzcD-associated flavoprotein CzcO
VPQSLPLASRAPASLPRVAVIGAGSSGITGLKGLVDAGLDAVCYEKSDRVGGNWAYRNPNGMSAAYRSLHINTSRGRMAYRDYPMPADYPAFPHHSQIKTYFDDYVDHFGLRDRIRFGCGVASAVRRDDGVWEVTDEHGGTEEFDAVVVANGHHWDPRWPEPAFPGSDEFRGIQMHAHSYDEPEKFVGKDVVVVGMGNSAMDIATELSWTPGNVYLSMRRGAYILPKYIAGKPLDDLTPEWLTRQIAKLPFKVRQLLNRKVFDRYMGDMQDYGLPKPDHKLLEAHPTISDVILSRITHGRVVPKPQISHFTAEHVHFTDGTSVHADAVIYATGYRVSFPFFDPEFLSAPDNELPLYRRVFSPDVDGVFFLALLQPLGATMPLAEAQGRWVADYLRGRYQLPSREVMRSEMAADRARMRKRYVASKRHTMQVDFDSYLVELEREQKKGRRRAAEAGHPLPIPGRAWRGASQGAATRTT